MTEEASSERGSLADKVGQLSTGALAAVGIFILLGVGSAGYYAYQTYDYIQHDNDFCMSCHLMAEPFELFAESAHQGLGCKACHRPNLIQRSQMGLTQIVENPQEISVHAAVPNEVCSECHIEGNPEEWRIIANTAGHRVHLESEDSILQGLQCVECHSTSIHEFAPIDRTCAQSGCHEDSQIQLGEMGDYTIHCAACHTFVAPVGRDGTLLGTPEDAALLPDFDECLSCHVMRQLVDMPADDPHEGGCAACHNPHEQTEPAQAAESCATVGCHDDVETVSSFHQGLDTDVLTDCLYCHQAHDFSLDGSDCGSCHEGAEAPQAVTAVQSLDFSHDEHESVECADCHRTGDSHGAVGIATVQDCRSCHHEDPLPATCDQCHEPSDAPLETYATTGAMVLPDVGVNDPDRTFDFPHGNHAVQDCGSCHSEGLAMGVSDDLDCASCHEDHHTATSDCASCHVSASVSAHPPEQAHVTCGGSGCHTDVPFETVPRTREFCLGCHQDMVDHEPQDTCSECHQLPAPLPQRGNRP